MMFFSLMVVMMLQMMLLQTSVAQVDVSMNPAHIDVGLSPSLDLNCTFSTNNANSAMAEIVSLAVSRGNDTDLASITTFSDHQVNVISSEGITADGVINPGGQSYIHLHWDYPTDTQKGTYQCVARGLDDSGQNVEVVNTSVVSVNQSDVQNLVDELNEMKHIQNALCQEVQEMQNYISQLENNVSSLNVEISNRIDLSTAFLLPPLSYNNKRYTVSKSSFLDFNDSNTICEAYGGILAEMDDLDEYHSVQNYLDTLFGAYNMFIYLGGTDEGHNGTWVLPSSNEELPVKDWDVYEPSRGELDNCLCLSGTRDWKMNAWHCHYDTVSINFKFMCEL